MYCVHICMFSHMHILRLSEGVAFIFAHCCVLSHPDMFQIKFCLLFQAEFTFRPALETLPSTGSNCCSATKVRNRSHTWPSRTNRDVSASVPLSGEPNGCCPRPAPTGAASAWLQHPLWLGHVTLRECQPAGQELRSTCWFSYSLHYHHRLCRFYCFHWEKKSCFCLETLQPLVDCHA